MFQVKLGEKVYRVDYVSASALYGIDHLMPVLNPKKGPLFPGEFGRDLDKLVNWFCQLFNNQFSLEEVYANYPADCLLRDIFFALMAVRSNMSEALVSFPTKLA